MARIAKPWFNREKNWWMVWLNGKQTKLAHGRHAKKEADTRLLELRLEAAKNPHPHADGQTVASVIESYLKIEGIRLAPSTLECHKHYLQSFADMHGWRLVAECEKKHVTSWLQEHPNWKSDWTKASAITIMQRPFNWAADEGMIEKNPFKGKRHPEGHPRRPVTPEEFRKLLKATCLRQKRKTPVHHRPSNKQRKRPTPGARFRQFLLFLWYTGCRPIEASQLRWEHIDWEHEIVILQHHKTSKRTKKPRVIPLIPVIVRLLRSIQRRNEGEFVFLTPRRTPWNKNSLGQRVARLRELAGIPSDAKLYGIRHAFGTRAIINSVDIKTLSELMGHTSTKMTEHYVHLTHQHPHLAAAMQRANGVHRAD